MCSCWHIFTFPEPLCKRHEVVFSAGVHFLCPIHSLGLIFCVSHSPMNCGWCFNVVICQVQNQQHFVFKCTLLPSAQQSEKTNLSVLYNSRLPLHFCEANDKDSQEENHHHNTQVGCASRILLAWSRSTCAVHGFVQAPSEGASRSLWSEVM